MWRRERRILGVGSTAMAAGTFLPWASATTWHAGTVRVGGFGHGAGWVLALAAATLLLLLLRLDLLAALTSLAAAAVVGLIAYELPGALVDTLPAWQAGLTWGAELSALGALAAVAASGLAVLRVLDAAVVEASAAQRSRRA